MWSETFEEWSLAHGLAVLWSAGVVAVAIFIRRGPMSAGAVSMDRLLGVFMLLAWIAQTVWWALPAQYQASESLPLHVCDIASLAAAFMLLTRVRLLRTLVYFWGLGLCSQAYITPTLNEGPARPAFWLFWLNHLLIVGTAVYDVIARRYRPSWGDYGWAIGLLLVYGIALIPLDGMTGWNYGFVGPCEPDTPTLLDVLGPWPWRVGGMAGLAAGVFALMVVVWKVPHRPRFMAGPGAGG